MDECHVNQLFRGAEDMGYPSMAIHAVHETFVTLYALIPENHFMAISTKLE
jgi:hypothetical protein